MREVRGSDFFGESNTAAGAVLCSFPSTEEGEGCLRSEELRCNLES